jgi:hypothetical protein
VADVELHIDPINTLDFDPALPCEHSQHHTDHPGNQPAMFEVEIYSKACHHKIGKRYLICLPGWEWLGRQHHLQCSKCGIEIPFRRDEVLRITQVFGGRR